MIHVFQGKVVKGIRVGLLLSGITWHWGAGRGVQLPCWKDTQAALRRGPCNAESRSPVNSNMNELGNTLQPHQAFIC